MAKKQTQVVVESAKPDKGPVEEFLAQAMATSAEADRIRMAQILATPEYTSGLTSRDELTQQDVTAAIEQAADAALESRVASALARSDHQDWVAGANAVDAKDRREARHDGFVRAALTGLLACPNLGLATPDAADNAIKCADEVMARLEAR